MLREAVALNPDAHFGREIWQIAAIEFVAAAQRKPELWRESSLLLHGGHSLPPVAAAFLGLQEQNAENDRHGRGLDPATAYRGIAGMVRFGQRDSGLLFHALAEVFLAQEHLNLAWWALRRAIEANHPASDLMQNSLCAIERHWRDAAFHTSERNASPDESLYTAVRANADRWLATFQRLEAAALARGEDVRSDAAVQALVAEADRAVPRVPMPKAWSNEQWLYALVVSAAVTAVIAKVWELWRRRTRPS